MHESAYEFLEESDFGDRDAAEIARIKQNAQFGKFSLTHAVRPALHFSPEEGFSCIYLDRKPAIIASVTREALGDILKKAIALFPDSMGILLGETSPSYDDPLIHGTGLVDRVLVESVLEDDEMLEFLLNDGRTGIHFYDSQKTSRTQLILDEDKLLVFQGASQQFRQLLERGGIRQKQNMLTINRMTHWHLCTAEHDEKFALAKQTLNLIDVDLDDDDEQEDWEQSLDDD